MRLHETELTASSIIIKIKDLGKIISMYQYFNASSNFSFDDCIAYI